MHVGTVYMQSEESSVSLGTPELHVPKWSKFGKFLDLKFSLDLAFSIKGSHIERLRFLLQKAHPCVNPRRLGHFA